MKQSEMTYPAYNDLMPRTKAAATRGESVRVYLFDNEKAHVEAKAGAMGISLAAYVRMLVLADMGQSAAQKASPVADEKPKRNTGI